MTVHRAMLVAVLLGAPRLSLSQSVYRFTKTTTLVQRGDTVWWIRRPTSPADSARGAPGAPGRTVPTTRLDTIIYLARADSVIILQPKPRRGLPPDLAKHFRTLLDEAKKAEDLRRRLP